MSKMCPVCGAKVGDSEVFCSECGNRFETQSQPVQQTQQNPYEQPAAQPQQNPYERPMEMPQHQNPYAQPEQTDRRPDQAQYGQQAQPVYQQPSQPAPQQNYYQPNQQYGQPQYYYAPPVQNAPRQEAVKKPGKGFAIASLVLGIMAVVNSLFLLLIDASAGGVSSYDAQNGYTSYAALGLKVIIIFFAIFVGICASLGITFGIISEVKARRGIALTGLIMSGVALIVVIFSFVVAANLKHPTTNDNLNSFYSFNEDDFNDYFDNYNFDID